MPEWFFVEREKGHSNRGLVRRCIQATPHESADLVHRPRRDSPSAEGGPHVYSRSVRNTVSSSFLISGEGEPFSVAAREFASAGPQIHVDKSRA